MVSWSDFEEHAPDFAAAGRRRLVGSDDVAIGFLATVSALGKPRLAPVCPIFCAPDLYLSAGTRTPKVADLRERGTYTLHAFLDENDEEFQISGVATEITDSPQRSAIHRAIPFKAFKTEDPIFCLRIDRALWVYWEQVGKPDTKAVRKRWRSPKDAA